MLYMKKVITYGTFDLFHLEEEYVAEEYDIVAVF